MPNPFFNALGGNGMNPMRMLQQFKANPMQFLMQRNMNVPQNIMNDPNAILQHLLSTGQISQSQINNAYQMLGNFRNRM